MWATALLVLLYTLYLAFFCVIAEFIWRVESAVAIRCGADKLVLQFNRNAPRTLFIAWKITQVVCGLIFGSRMTARSGMG
jgi:hypothetical protein